QRAVSAFRRSWTATIIYTDNYTLEISRVTAQDQRPRGRLSHVIQIPEEGLFLRVDQETIGPLRMNEIRDKFQDSEITRATFLWFAGLDNWITVGDIPEFDRRISR